MNGIDLIAAERHRQLTEEGYSPEHDDEHIGGELALAAACYAAPVIICASPEDPRNPRKDPFPHGWKDKRPRFGVKLVPPNFYSRKLRIELLVKAGALIVAEIERLIRVEDADDHYP